MIPVTLVLALVFAVAAAMSHSFILLSAIFATASVVCFASLFKKGKVAIPLLFVIFFIIPVSVFRASSDWIFQWFPFNGSFVSGWFENETVLPATKQISGVEKLVVKLRGGTILEFNEENANEIRVPSEVEVNRFGNTIEITGALPPRTVATIEIGAIDEVEIDGSGVVIRGTAKLKDSLVVDGSGVVSDADLNTQIIRIDGSGVVMKGDINCDFFQLNGSGAVIKTRITAERAEIDSSGAVLDLRVLYCPSLSVSGSGIKISVEYLEEWEGIWSLKIDGVAASISIDVPEGLRDNLDLDLRGVKTAIDWR